MEFIDYLKQAIPLLNVVVTIALFFTVQRINKEKATNETITKLTERLIQMETRVTVAPSKVDISDLHEKINGMGRTLATLEGESRATYRIVNLLHETMMERK